MNIRFFLIFLGLFMVTACNPASSGSGNVGSGNYDCRYSGTCPRRYPDYSTSYGSGYHYDRPHDRDYDSDHHRHDYDKDDTERWHDHDADKEQKRPAPTPIPRVVIRPSCPPDTTFDGKHCIIPEDKRRKGGKGTVSACPNGMWVSNGECVGK
jgi:hypothetical protein